MATEMGLWQSLFFLPLDMKDLVLINGSFHTSSMKKIILILAAVTTFSTALQAQSLYSPTIAFSDLTSNPIIINSNNTLVSLSLSNSFSPISFSYYTSGINSQIRAFVPSGSGMLNFWQYGESAIRLGYGDTFDFSYYTLNGVTLESSWGYSNYQWLNGSNLGNTSHAAMLFDNLSGYIGVALQDTNTLAQYFGWINYTGTTDVVNGATIGTGQITGFAFETIPGQPITAGAIPEPSTYALFGIGALALVVAYRRKVA